MSATDELPAGLHPANEKLLTAPPAEPDLREAVNMWVWDEAGQIGLPRIAVEALGQRWQERAVQVNIAFPDGRVLLGTTAAAAHDDRADSFGAGPLSFHCVEPFRRWTAAFDGPASWTDVQAQLAGDPPAGAQTHVSFTIEAEMVTPPYLRGRMDPQSAEIVQNTEEGNLVGRGYNYKQLFRGEATFRAGDIDLRFRCGGLRVRRRGYRDSSKLRGHCWQSAVFPSGRAFAYTCFPPRDDGMPAYNEGFVYVDGRMIPATATRAPWMTRFDGSVSDVSFVLATGDASISIGGEVAMSTYVRRVSDLNERFGMPFLGGGDLLGFQQGIARYSWDGEVAYGMVERSYPFAAMDPPVAANPS
jgi:hypothetical protein